jgi:predicted AlkP superfamily pyrophosphatase or phosphodiesterase
MRHIWIRACYTRTMRLWFALCLLLMTSPLRAADVNAKLVVISIDGLDYRFLRDADRLHLKIPVLRKLMARGAMADGVVGMPPTDPWPSATTLVTGVPPARHGVTASDRLDQASKIPTLWQAAVKAHRKTVLLNWPATTTDSADFVCPQVWDRPQQSTLPFDPIAQKCTPGLVTRVASVYPRFTKSLWNDESSILALNYLLQYENPDLCLVHLGDLDAEQHETGALSLYSHETLENDDELLGQMLVHLQPNTLVAIVSGNGFETEEHVVRPRVLAGSSLIEVKYGLIGTTDSKVAATLRKLLPLKKNGLSREVPMLEVKRYAPDLVGWVAAFSTQPGYVPIEGIQGPAVGPGSHKGVHGLWPARPNYRSVFIVSGGHVRAGHLGEISTLEIAPTLAALIGVSLPDARQPSLAGKFRK